MTLRIERATFGYTRARAPVLRDVSAAFEPGAVTAVVGPNGAGKTTLLRLALGLLRPWSGRTTLAGADTARLRGRARAGALAYVAQRPSVAADFTARQIVRLGRFALRADEGAVDRALAAMDVAERADDPFATLSAGQQQRVSLARAIAQLDPAGGAPPGARALLADEPFASLDPRHALLAAGALRRLAGEGVAVGVVLHDLTGARRWADRALVLGETGSVAAEGPVAETLSPPILTKVFGTPFDLVKGPGGAALLPAQAATRGAADAGRIPSAEPP